MFCYKVCDGLYHPLLQDENTSYEELKELVLSGIRPASEKEIKRWETEPTEKELTEIPHKKYLRFLHPNLRPLIINNWDMILLMEI